MEDIIVPKIKVVKGYKLIDWLHKEGLNIHSFEKENGFSSSRIYNYIYGHKTPTRRLSEEIERATGGEVPKEVIMWPSFFESKVTYISTYR